MLSQIVIRKYCYREGRAGGTGPAFCSRQILQEQGGEELRRKCERQNAHCNALPYIHSSLFGGPNCGTGGCPPGHTITSDLIFYC